MRLGFFGVYFDTDKNFILPRGLQNLKRIQAVYERFPSAKLLIVGHTDTAGTPEYNDELSLERAESMAAYLPDDVDAWLARYEDSVKESKRWGRREDIAMLRHVRARNLATAREQGRATPAPAQRSSRLTRRSGCFSGRMASRTTASSVPSRAVCSSSNTWPKTAPRCRAQSTLPPTGAARTSRWTRADSTWTRRPLIPRGMRSIAASSCSSSTEAKASFQRRRGRTRRRDLQSTQPWRREAKTVGDFTVGGIGVIAARSNTRFSQEKSFPKPSLLPTLRKLVGLLDGDAQLDLEIVGHADPRGDRGRNIHLSKSRAEAVGGW